MELLHKFIKVTEKLADLAEKSPLDEPKPRSGNFNCREETKPRSGNCYKPDRKRILKPHSGNSKNFYPYEDTKPRSGNFFSGKKLKCGYHNITFNKSPVREGYDYKGNKIGESEKISRPKVASEVAKVIPRCNNCNKRGHPTERCWTRKHYRRCFNCNLRASKFHVCPSAR